MKIKQLKQSGKKMLRKNLGTLILVAIFMSFFVGEYVISNNGYKNIQSVGLILQEQNGKKFLDSIFNNNQEGEEKRIYRKNN